MNTLLNLIAGEYRVSFGIPSTKNEYQGMFDLRYRVYHEELGYGNRETHRSDKDAFDKSGQVLYLIAKVKGRIVGCMRIVTTDVLPTERFYEFDHQFPSSQKGDWGRLISRPHWFGFGDIPRGVISTGLLLASIKLCEQKKILHGYGTMKKKALQKIQSRGFPVRILHPKKVIGMKGIDGDPLQNFFSPNDPVVPLTFSLMESKRFMIVLKENYFKIIDENTWKVPKKISSKTKINIWIQSLWIRLGH